MSKRKFIKYIPNCLTVTNMLLGFTAIIILMQTDLANKEMVVVVLMLFGGALDFLDGYIARKLKVSTNIGKQLDSFADLVTFGIVPVCLVNYMSFCGRVIPIAISSGIFLIMGVYRLARYNLSEYSNHFIGLPITVAGIFLGIYCLIYYRFINYQHSYLCTIMTSSIILLLSILMVSRVKIKRACSS